MYLCACVRLDGYCSLTLLALNLLPRFKRMSIAELNAENGNNDTQSAAGLADTTRTSRPDDENKSNNKQDRLDTPTTGGQQSTHTDGAVSAESDTLNHAATRTRVASVEVGVADRIAAASQPHRRPQPSSAPAAPADHNPLAVSPTMWIVFFVFTLHFAFSLIRTIYTSRKNGRYNWGYLL